MDIDICEYISFLAQKSVLYEVSVSPKPGLVDRYNNGAHTDMNFFSFISSASSLQHGFYKMAKEGTKFEGNDYRKLLERIRPIGIETEQKMYNATNGVNTHKGIIFSIGIICAAAANIYKNNRRLTAENICELIKEITHDITKEELNKINKENTLTHGEMQFKKYGLTGIRGEVESGFLTVREKGLPVLRQVKIEDDRKLNDVLLYILLNIMTICEDTNIVSRHNVETVEYVQSFAKEIVNKEKSLYISDKERIEQMDKIFISKNISPGGSADLLAVTIMLALLEGKKI